MTVSKTARMSCIRGVTSLVTPSTATPTDGVAPVCRLQKRTAVLSSPRRLQAALDE